MVSFDDRKNVRSNVIHVPAKHFNIYALYITTGPNNILHEGSWNTSSDSIISESFTKYKSVLYYNYQNIPLKFVLNNFRLVTIHSNLNGFSNKRNSSISPK